MTDNNSVILDRRGLLTRVPDDQRAFNGFGVKDGVIDERTAGVLMHYAQVIGCGEFVGFSGLPHQVHEIRFDRGRFAYGFGNAGHQKIWNYAGK